MSRTYFWTVRLLAGLLLLASTARSQPMPTKKALLATMTRANDYFMAKWPDAGKETVTNKVRPSNIWTRAVYYEGLMALYSVDRQKRYYDYAIEWGTKHKWGMRSGPLTRNADDQCCGQTYLNLYELDGRKHPERIEAIKSSIDNMLKTDKADDWDWIDALQMAMPIFAKMGVLYNEPRYFEKMYDMYRFTRDVHGGKGLYNPADRLWWRDKDFVPPYTEPNGQDCYWSRGNGWIVAALVRVLDSMPKNAPHRAEYEKMYLDMMGALLPLQRPDGFWNVSLHDPTHFGGPELTGTALFVYGMAWGINHGLLNRKTYGPAAAKAWSAMTTTCVHPTGFLGYVQGTGKEPKDGQPVTYTSMPDFEDYGLGCFLLAGTELYKGK
ncbi:glycoside hydrolase family 88 protein [Rudanella paleaurantiibacter]|uniref:Glycoside hydrolase family 88 protein n=1 Tax=Rudanella paleaurantiibacter TaxID=2614655 RepID=A0A7J5TXZ8_9BACT|nr:glycoside hydrolase family 88 protein [Rudanella paleaurantiibacter]KAB7730019.1 glycoside hydrolase family 88 protein [Rudanella paleaurantiibacter]